MSFQPQLNPYYGRIPPGDTSYPPQVPFVPTLDPATARLAVHAPFQPHTLITLTLLSPHPAPTTPATAPVSVRAHPARPRHPPSTTSSSTETTTTTTTTLFITHKLTRTVAVALDPRRAPSDPTRYVLKLRYTTRDELWRREHELDAYTHLACLQGAELPWCFGEWAAAEMPRGGCSVLLLEMALPGTSVGALVGELAGLPVAVGDELEDREARWRRARLRVRIMGLHGSAVRAVDRVQACGAGHHGWDGGKFVVAVTESERWVEEVVVLVGWGNAMVDGVRGGWSNEWWTRVHAAFCVGGGVGEGWS